MHESGIAARIVDVAVARAAAAGPERITDVYLEIGAGSGVAPESLELYWPHVSQATPAEGARLHIRPADDPLACRIVAIDVTDRVDPAGPAAVGPARSRAGRVSHGSIRPRSGSTRRS
jgi:Zn finger protein HypA/HybF involved in hydrogenase expression